MANPEHLAKLNKGTVSWNAWRDECLNSNGNHSVDLHEADLRKADLGGANLRGAILTKANLCKVNINSANLSLANLGGAHLDGANLSNAKLMMANLVTATLDGANLSKADLFAANLSMANLSKADLSNAHLSGANLNKTDLFGATLAHTELTGTDFSSSYLGNTTFAFLDLSTIKGLDTCIHSAPNSIDYHTLKQSGSLPLNFLRGSGLPDVFIDYLPSLFEQPIHYYSCFISYSSQDEEFTRRLYSDLQENGVRCWYAPEDMKIGDKFRIRIDEVIRLHDKLLIVLSDQSVTSEWVDKEIETAFEKERKNKEVVLFPIRLDDAVLHCDTGWAADIRRSRHIGDFAKWKDHDTYKVSFNRLLRDLKTE